MQLRGIRVVALAFVAGAAGFSVEACSGIPAPSGFSTSTRGSSDGGAKTGRPDDPSLGESDAAVGPPCVPSPDNAEIPENGCDDDGDGTVDNPGGCDASLPIAGDAMAFAKAIGLCHAATGTGDASWGVISASYSNGHGRTNPPNPAQHGILSKFGNVIRPREGKALGVLSTGFAREFDSATGTLQIFKKDGSDTAMQTVDGYTPTPGRIPVGFPKPARDCTVDERVLDTIVVTLQIKVPANAKGLSFDFNFWSGEWPEYVCTKFNDGFIAYLTSSAFHAGEPDNISFDAQNNPVSVNNGFFDRCTPNTPTGCKIGAGGVKKTAACPGGTSELQGTGFGAPEANYCGNAGSVSSPGGATGWLTSTAPVAPGEVITLEYIIWDTGDPNFDSSVLIDNFRWIPGEVHTKTERPK